MRKTSTFFSALFICRSVVGKTVPNANSVATTGQNYILTKTFRNAGVPIATLNKQRTTAAENQMFQCFDGFGRQSQTIKLIVGISYKDNFKYMEYDDFVRESVKYLSHVKILVVNSSSKITVKADRLAYYVAANTSEAALVKTGNPFSVTVFENSPLYQVRQHGVLEFTTAAVTETARGIKETYTYDGMQRLQAILDHLNNINRSFDYHYRPN